MLRSSLAATTLSFLTQTAGKQLLSEGEKFVMTLFDVVKFADQGIYDVVNNLSSLAARFLLSPIEETSYQTFCKYIDRSRCARDQEPGCLAKAGQLLASLVRGVSLVGALIFVFGFNFAHLSLLIYAGADFAAAAGVLLRWQSLYILIIAINGVTESFVVACMHQRQLNTFNGFLALLSLILVSASVLLTPRFSTLGFVIANCIHMLFRILHSCHFISKYFQQSVEADSRFRLRSCVPDPLVLASLALAFALLRGSEEMFCCSSLTGAVTHVALGSCLLLLLTCLVHHRERALVRFFADTLSSKSSLPAAANDSDREKRD